MKKLTKRAYDSYIRVVNSSIRDTENRLKNLDIFKKISQLSFEDWIKFQNGELKIKDL